MKGPLRLPADRPLDEQGLVRHSEYRLGPVIDMLCGQLDPWLFTTPASARHAAPLRLGLFGGLGQGKSTVVEVALARLQARTCPRQRWHDLLLGSRIARFDVSYFKADDLEWRFFTAVLLRRALRNALLAGALVLLVWWLLPDWRPQVLALLGGATLLKLLHGMSAGVKSAASLHPAPGLYVAFKDLLIQTLARLTLALPAVVVVDDLDRARVEQQRSFLRALSRYSRCMGFAVVVCMDESELLATAPSPDAPEEMLRKNLTAELRVPDRSLEDVALLAAVCLREFASNNMVQAPALCEGLRSVQFVGDFARVLMLDTAHAPNSPRKVQRLLTHVAMQAAQLGLCKPDDLGALLRLEGLYRLAPMLRQRSDALRVALELNRAEAFDALLAEIELPAQRAAEARTLFLRTRMMKPALRDGWFRLLGGFRGDHFKNDGAGAPWIGSWAVARRSVDLLRAIVEAVGQDAGGYPHSLTLSASAHQDIFNFEMPGGTREEFSRGDLPPGVLRGASEYDEHCWLAWVCALRAAAPQRRHALCRRAWAWSMTLDPLRRRAARDLVLREALADCDMWAALQTSQRHWWWDQVHLDSEASLEGVFGLALRDDDFADAWRVLGRAGNGVSRDGRKVLAWWGHLSPQVDSARVGADVADPVFGSTVWPAPDLLNANTARARNELARHLAALASLRTVAAGGHRVPNPQPLREALRRALDELLPQHLLELIAPLAFDAAAPAGQRWSLEAPRRWIEDIRHHALHKALRQWVVDGSTPAAAGLLHDVNTLQRRALLIVVLLSDWQPQQPQRLLGGIDPDELQELCALLEDRGLTHGWLAAAAADGD